MIPKMAEGRRMEKVLRPKTLIEGIVRYKFMVVG